MEKVARPAAELEFNSWLDFKRVKESKRKEKDIKCLPTNVKNV